MAGILSAVDSFDKRFVAELSVYMYMYTVNRETFLHVDNFDCKR